MVLTPVFSNNELKSLKIALVPSTKDLVSVPSPSTKEVIALCKLSIIGSISFINIDAPILYASDLSLSDLFRMLSISATVLKSLSSSSLIFSSGLISNFSSSDIMFSGFSALPPSSLISFLFSSISSAILNPK